MTSKRILFQFFRDPADSDKGHEGGGMAEAGGQKEEEKGIGQISVKIIFYCFLHAFNPVQSNSS